MILQPPRESLKKLVNLRDPVLAGNVGRCVTCIHFEFHSCRQNLIMWHEIYGADCQYNHFIFAGCDSGGWGGGLAGRGVLCQGHVWTRGGKHLSRSCVNMRKWAFVKVMCEHQKMSICQGHLWTWGGEHLSRYWVNMRRKAFVKVMCEVSICQGHVWGEHLLRSCVRWAFFKVMCEHQEVSFCQRNVWTLGGKFLSRACEQKSVSRLHVKKRNLVGLY